MSALEKLMDKKKDKPLDENYKNAKMSMLAALHQEMQKMMGDKLHGAKQVSIAAPDSEGLKEGLDTAQGMLGNDESEDGEEGEDMGVQEGDQAGIEEAEEEIDPELQKMSPEEIDELIQHLEKVKSMKA